MCTIKNACSALSFFIYVVRFFFFFFSSRRRHTRYIGDWSSDVCSSDLTGKLRWSFHTIPHPGEFGYGTWPKQAWKTSGAANNWAGMALDAKRGILYVPKIGRASCRERVWISGVAEMVKEKEKE